MRIAHVSDFYLPRLGGIEMHIAALAARQRDAGHHVDVVTATAGAAELSRRGAVLPAAEGGGALARMRPSVIERASAIVRDGGYDVVHVHAGVLTPLAFGVATSASNAGVPTVVTGHSLVQPVFAAYKAADVVAKWSRLPIAWTAVSDLAAGPYRRIVGPSVPVAVLPNAIDAEAWRIQPGPRDPDHVVIAAVMRLAARKRPLHLVRALREVRAQVPDRVRLSAVIVGDGPQRRRVQRYLARHDMADWVDLPGFFTHEQIRALYRRADVFVAPAHLESFGIAALEARAAGLPVVAKARAGISEFIRHEREGLLVGDDRDMATAIATLATDVATRRAIARHNAEVVPSFGWPEALARAELEYARAQAIQDERLPLPRVRTRLVRAEAAG